MNNRRHVNLYLEANPNPNSLKFVANYTIVEPGSSFDFPNPQSAEHAPLAMELFQFPFVDRVFYMSNFITITKRSEFEWVEIQDQLKQFITDWLTEERPLLISAQRATDTEAEDPEIVRKIKNILDDYVKPAVEQDGGAITFHSFEEGVVRLILQGSCSGCPSSTVTLKSGIENLMKRMIPEVETVEAVGI
jgi:Fe-S cluster biogenesis protein NfuA